MVKKAPRCAAERILEVMPELLERSGGPNVSTTLMPAAPGIGPGKLYRNPDDLPRKNRWLESHFQGVLKNKADAVRALPGGMGRTGALAAIYAREAEATATGMAVLPACGPAGPVLSMCPIPALRWERPTPSRPPARRPPAGQSACALSGTRKKISPPNPCRVLRQPRKFSAADIL